MGRNNVFRTTIFAAIMSFAMPAFAADWDDTVIARIPDSLPMVRDVSWGQPGSLWLFVSDDGTNRDGLAQTACASMKYYDGTPSTDFVIIRVFDAATAAAGNGSDLLGYAECNL